METKLIFDIICSSIFILFSFIIGNIALNNWLNAKFNHENRFYWAMSYFVFIFITIINVISNVFDFHNMSLSVHIVENFAYFFILNAILYTLICCDCKHNCVVCKRKKIRLFTWLGLILITFIQCIIYAVNPIYFNITSELLQSLVVLCIFCILPIAKNFILFKLTFFLMAVKDFIQALTFIYLLNLYNIYLYNLNLILSVIVSVMMFISVYKNIQQK